MRCPDCAKFVSFEEGEDVEELSADFDAEDLTFRGEFRIVDSCAECSAELREAIFIFEHTFDRPEGHDDHTLTCEWETGRESRWEPGRKGFAATYHGVEVNLRLRCSCGKHEDEEILSDDMKASDMDQLV